MYSVISPKILLYFFLMSCIIGCNSETKKSRLLFEILQESKEPIIKKVLSDLNSHEVQILFTRIHRDSLRSCQNLKGILFKKILSNIFTQQVL